MVSQAARIGGGGVSRKLGYKLIGKERETLLMRPGVAKLLSFEPGIHLFHFVLRRGSLCYDLKSYRDEQKIFNRTIQEPQAFLCSVYSYYLDNPC